MNTPTDKYAVPIQFCPECGQRILENDLSASHLLCINWGIRIGKYKVPSDWTAACVKNGLRVSSSVPL